MEFLHSILSFKLTLISIVVNFVKQVLLLNFPMQVSASSVRAVDRADLVR